MSLINYVEPLNVGSIFLGLGSMILTIVISYILLKCFKPVQKWIEGIYNHDQKYWIVEEKMLDLVGKDKGIDLDAELIKRNFIETPRKNFRKRMEDEVFEKMFPESNSLKKTK